MNQRKTISAGSWAATVVVLLFGFWLHKRFGFAAMWTALSLILGVVVALNIWMGFKAARQRLYLQELIHKLADGKSIEELQSQHPDFLSTIRTWQDASIEDTLAALDENQARDLRKALGRSDPSVPN
jgi:hypothetical protein